MITKKEFKNQIIDGIKAGGVLIRATESNSGISIRISLSTTGPWKMAK